MRRSAVLTVVAYAAGVWVATVVAAARQTPAPSQAQTQAQADQDTIAPLALTRPTTPAVAWRNWSSPLDRFVGAYLSTRGAEPAAVSDARFARRVYLDAWGLL